MLESATTARVGRKMEFPDRLTLPLAAGVVDRIDAVLEPGEYRLDLIREAIDREVLKRLTAKARRANAEREFKGSPPTLPSKATSKDAE